MKKIQISPSLTSNASPSSLHLPLAPLSHPRHSCRRSLFAGAIQWSRQFLRTAPLIFTPLSTLCTQHHTPPSLFEINTGLTSDTAHSALEDILFLSTVSCKSHPFQPPVEISYRSHGQDVTTKKEIQANQEEVSCQTEN